MANVIHTVKIAESHLSTIIEALGNLPFARVHPIVTSLVSQVRAEKEAAAKEQIKSFETPKAEAAE